mmetsp:Transcript_36967/g.59829  ORF Transcript_36967/g.59829 Transcript_36967/m.59829 type:complete len:418 (+) Transcript_36967:90-1343(+)|eukprot:CAMPEP_0184656324 /NCGR_PEP_ID=MMETSP0308-20130426/16322_1 /TAXON_ID=38269 /ORGANISM="Gloeochaete witrockiana, Strain SAG 46.84" /LENGTH=417 /DNA_ID=CAMNT_0027093391 /DNA_START=50 /DNA_END=1303 /DNA_ORIENTATION=+
MGKQKVCLAYSGGLDTSCILKWLVEEKGYEVIAYMADVGQKEDFEVARQKALKVGASKVYIEDLRKDFVDNFVWPAVKANGIYESRYLLGTSLARPCIAKSMVGVANKEGCKFISHGATGKGNDQVRFELSVYALDPAIEIIAPWRMPEFFNRFQGRSDLMKYAEQHNIPVSSSPKAPWSMDENLMHCSYESGVLEDPRASPPKEMFHVCVSPQDAPDKTEKIVIRFKDGTPIEVENLDDKKKVTGSVELLEYLNDLGRKHGIGRIDIVENRFVGIKSRGVYETPGVTILRAAHLDIEGIAMDREVMRLRDMLSPKFAELTYYGFWFAPEMDFLMAAIDKSQEYIDGEVELALYKGTVIAVGRSSPTSLYSADLASMEIAGGYNPVDADGFIKINAVRLKAHRAIVNKIASESKAKH